MPTRLLPLRPAVVVLTALALALLSLTIAAPPSRADSNGGGTLTVVGTSDVSDSGLVQAVLAPGFHAAYPKYTINYVPKGTGAAITYAEAGTASALLVHAASLENQFVGGGYSLEPYGRAIFYGDFILAGGKTDPVGVKTADAHDIVSAFEDIATAGAAGHASFVSRADTSGTAVQEHAIWALTTGVTTCDVSTANGGGEAPSTVTGPCPSTPSYPSWYVATGLTQGPNVEAADSCAPAGSSPNNCYVFTDRGTYDFLANTNAISNLEIVTRDNDSAAAGGDTLLVNSFHAYAINPNAPTFNSSQSANINVDAAQKFLTWITSPAAQAAVGKYLANVDSPPPFLPDATPALTSNQPPKTIAAGSSFTIAGTLKNVVPGTPALSFVNVSLLRRPSTQPTADPTVVATAQTDANGHYSISYKPTRNAKYWVETGTTYKIENSSLSPVFGDRLEGASKALYTVKVDGAVHVTSATGKKGKVTFKGTVSPKTIGSGAHLSLYGVKTADASDGLTYLGKQKALDKATSSFTVTFKLPKGHWTLRLKYVNSDVIGNGDSAKEKVTVS